MKDKRRITKDFIHMKEHLQNAKKAICMGVLEEAKYHINLAQNIIIEMEKANEKRRESDEVPR